MKYSPAIEASMVERCSEGQHIVGPDADYRPDGNIVVTVDHLSQFLHRRLYTVMIGELTRSDFLLANCKYGKRCQNPLHRRKASSPSGRERKPRAPRPTTGEPNAPELNAAKTHCPNGHEYTPENTYTWTDKKGREHRKCKTCTQKRTRAQHRAARQNRKANTDVTSTVVHPRD